MKKMKKIFIMLGLAVLAPIVAVPCMADDLKDCMADMMDQVSESTTIGDLRLKCEEQLQAGTYKVEEQEPGVATERFRKDKEHVLEPFTIMAHRPNYLLVGAYNSNGYSAKYFREQYDDSSISFDDTEAQFQVSIKVPLLLNLFDMVDVYGAYTNRSFWQYSNGDISSPFRETNHEPEIWAQFSPGWQFFGTENFRPGACCKTSNAWFLSTKVRSAFSSTLLAI